MDELTSIGPGDPPIAPHGYTPLTSSQRSEWNGFLDYVGKQQGVNLDKDPSVGITLLNQYKKANPNFTLTPDHIKSAQYEAYLLRKGDKFGELGPEQLKYIRQGLPEAYLNRPIPEATGKFDSATAKLYYPQKGTYGTDLEGYVKGVASGTPPPPAPVAGAIPLPDYDNSNSRLNYAKGWTKKYGPLMQGRGDTPLRINEIPPDGTDTSKNLSIKAASKLGIDPALLYSSAMEEGMSGVFPNANSQIDEAQDPKFPVNGFASFGLDNFADAYPGLVKKGYLSPEFAKNFNKSVNYNEKKEKVNSADFKTVDAALEAKAAMVKDAQDRTEDYAKKNGIPLSDRAKQFFTLVGFNAGEGNMRKMLSEYNKRGYLKDDNFIYKRPSESWKQPWENVARRIQMADALKKEGLMN